MARRNRAYYVRYGGERAGIMRSGFMQPDVPVNLPAYPSLHSCSDETHPGPPYRTGGPLLVKKRKVFIHRLPSLTTHYYQDYRYDGKICVLPYIPPVEPAPRSLSAWGALGWNRTFPLHPIYQLGVSLLELKDFPRMISQTMKGFAGLAFGGVKFTSTKRSVASSVRDIGKGPKHAASHYLNVQFGWVPFMQDLLAILEYQERLAKKLAWLRRHNGKRVRRKITLYSGGFSEAIPRTVASHSTISPAMPSSYNYGPGGTANRNWDITKTYKAKIWYSAEYLFYVPELEPKASAAKLRGLKRQLYGLSLDPVVIYKVMPWSWLLDWFVNVGVVLQNLVMNAKNLTVARYAYVMGKEDYSYDAPGGTVINLGEYYLDYPTLTYKWSGGSRAYSGVSRTEYEFRQRMEASPYGFGSTFTGFSSFQWSILVALGLGKAYKPF